MILETGIAPYGFPDIRGLSKRDVFIDMKINNENKQYFGRDLDAMSVAENYYDWILSEYKPFFGHRVMEVGAGVGTVTQMMLDRGAENIIATEPSENMYPMLKERFLNHEHVTTFNAFLSELPREQLEGVDTLVYINVMEHVEDDIAEIRHAYEVLPSKGRILIFVPALQWVYGEFDKNLGHYRRYNRRELHDKVEQAGFKVAKNRYFDSLGFIPWFIFFKLLRLQSLNPGQMSIYDKLVVPILRPIEKLIPPLIGKNLFLVGEKV